MKKYPIAPQSLEISASGCIFKFNRGYGVLLKKCRIVRQCPLGLSVTTQYHIDDDLINEFSELLKRL